MEKEMTTWVKRK